jgi:hypothetical protein
VPQVRLRDGTVTVQYKGWGKPWDWRKRTAELTLNQSIPWTIDIHGGASRINGDLRTVDLAGLLLNGGVDTMRLALGSPSGAVPVRVIGGANKVRIDRPAGVAIRLRLVGGAAGIELDRQKLGATGGGTVLESANAGDATDVFEVEVTGGSSRIQITERA